MATAIYPASVHCPPPTGAKRESRFSYPKKVGVLKNIQLPFWSSSASSMHGDNAFKFSLLSRIAPCCHCRAVSSRVVVKSNYPQNADLPRYYSKKEKKPFPIPIVELRRAARERLKNAKGKPRRPTPPPRNGMLVRSLIPVAYEVLNARILLINNIKKLLKVVPMLACKHCNEIHVGVKGHPFKSCRGLRSEARRGLHEWTSEVTVDDILVPLEAFHISDRLGKRISHQERFTIPRIPAIVELCIQAGVDLPEYPTKRRRKPVIRVGKSEIIDGNEDDLLDDFDPYGKFKKPILADMPDSEIIAPSGAEEIVSLAEATLEAWELLREGVERMMRKYAVRVCGYCPELHVGPSGHKAQNCGAFKHQQRNGQHGWQTAVLDDLIPPRYVWHVPQGGHQELQRELRAFYGQAPAVVEMCVQGGAKVPEKYMATMRLDIGIPTSLREAEMVCRCSRWFTLQSSSRCALNRKAGLRDLSAKTCPSGGLKGVSRYAMTGQLTQKSDVYSFGVVLLELLTVDHTMPGGQQSLVTWVGSTAQEAGLWCGYLLMSVVEVVIVPL